MKIYNIKFTYKQLRYFSFSKKKKEVLYNFFVQSILLNSPILFNYMKLDYKISNLIISLFKKLK